MTITMLLVNTLAAYEQRFADERGGTRASDADPPARP
jgi:hypothetical protein